MSDQGESDNSVRLQIAVDFLRRVLPQEGFKCAWVVDGNKKFNVFFSTVDGLAFFVLQQDASGRTVYHACSSFRSNIKAPKGTPRAQRRLGRTQHNVLAVRSLWADVDCGEGKPYPTQLDGAEHVAAFCRRTGLPAPLYVGSGNGLHLYWPLDEALGPETWRRYAAGLAKLFVHHGLHVDTTRTQDLSSVLRTPGTHHRKDGLKEVIAGPLVGPYPLQLFERLLHGGPVQRLPLLPRISAVSSLVVHSQTGGRAGAGADFLGGLYDDRPASAERVARDCRQLAALEERRGQVTEPHWHAALGVLAHCVDGRDRAHQWSDPEWHGAIDEKLERLAGFGPTTCAKFASLDRDGCVGCRWSGRISSPIQLGRRSDLVGDPAERREALERDYTGGATTNHGSSGPDPRAAQDGVGFDSPIQLGRGHESIGGARTISEGPNPQTASGRGVAGARPDGAKQYNIVTDVSDGGAPGADRRTVHQDTTGFCSAVTQDLPTAPTDFVYTGDGKLVHVRETKNGAAIYDTVCEFPIYLKAIQTAEIDEGRYGLVFREKKARSEWRDIVVTARQALGRDASTELAERGVTIHDGELWRKYVRSAIDLWHREKDVEKRYDQFGWKDGERAFLVGKRLYTSDRVLPATGSPTLEHRAQYLGPQANKKASLERWQAAANKLFAAGLEHQSLAVLCGFAAPLMRFHAEGEGGAIVSFVSDRTASGKTTALEAAASIWGAHRGLKLDETDTKVAKGLKLGVLGNLPCTFDELQQRDPELIREFVLTFTNGTDKDRGTAEGGLKINKSEWQTILLTASNTSLVDLLSNMNASDAPAARILEFTTELPPHVEKEDFEEIRRELNFNHGFAGDAYIKKLVQPEIVEWVRSNIPMWSAEVRKAAHLEEKHRFWVRLMVSVIAAGTIVEGMGLLDFSMPRITRWLIDYAAEGASSIRGASQTDAASSLAAALSEFYLDTLIVDGEYKAGKRSHILRAPSRQMLVRYEVENKRLFLSETALKKWLVKSGVNIRGFVDTLKKQGVVLGEVRKVTLGAGTDLASGQTPVLTINMLNPLVSGVAADLEKALPEGPIKTRADRIKEMQR
jgi:Domain of unknown function (DUF927)